MKQIANCDCGRYHPPVTNPKSGDRVRVRAHWRNRHMCGTVLRVREGFNEPVVCDVVLDQNESGLKQLNALLPSELWQEN